MMHSTRRKTMVVTGAGAGIGRVIAIELAGTGGALAVTDLNPDAAHLVAEEIRGTGGEARAFKLDVTRQADADKTADAVIAAWGSIDVWVNNAGVSTMRPFLELTAEDWRLNMAVNAGGTFLCSQSAARRMIRQPADPASGLRGTIINIASMAAKRGNAPFLAHYVASKFAVAGLTQAMAGELAAHQITVNAVCPGYVQTDMQARELQWEAEIRGIDPESVKRMFVKDTPLGRLERPQDVAGVVRFLASPAAAFITGEAIQVNGGAWMD